MRVLQLIDSLDGGGAERVAVNFANALADAATISAICSTRKEGILKEQLRTDVVYLFLNKRGTFDFGALKRLKNFVKQHQIEVVHAHATSFFFATLLKIIYPKITVIWHEHLGSRITTKRTDNLVLYFCSFFFESIITVNATLKTWAIENLKTAKVFYLSNFVAISDFNVETIKRKNRIVCLANLRKPKNHMNLLTAFTRLAAKFPSWNLHLIGKETTNVYAQDVREFIKSNALEERIFIEGSSSTVASDLLGCKIGVLASDSEGLPMALLEYGAAGLAVVATDVGYCKEVIDDTGIVVPPKDSDALADALRVYVVQDTQRDKAAALFQNRVRANYSIEAVLPTLLKIYRN